MERYEHQPHPGPSVPMWWEHAVIRAQAEMEDYLRSPIGDAHRQAENENRMRDAAAWWND